MKVLVACEESQEVCKAFRARGHEAYSCDLLPCSGGHPEWHIQDDAVKVLWSNKWDLVIAHPPCTRLANSGVRWLSSKREREGYVWSDRAKIYLRDDPKIWDDFYKGVKFLNDFILYGKLGKKIAIEQPVHHKYAIEEVSAPYTQSIQPYMFGHTEKKETHLWLFGLPNLIPTNNVFDDMMKLSYKDRSKIHYASPGPERAKIRSKTYPGIALAMAAQWG